MDRHLDAVLAELVIRNRLRRGKIRYTRKGGPLVLQVEADGERCRKWLATFYKTYHGIVPINEPEAATEKMRDPPDLDAEVAEELLNIAHGCGVGGRPPYRLPIVFPRFAAAYTMLVAWKVEGGHRARRDPGLVTEVNRAVRDARRTRLPELRRRIGQLIDDPNVRMQQGGLVGLIIAVISICRLPASWPLRWFRKKGFPQSPRTTQALIGELRRLRARAEQAAELTAEQTPVAQVDEKNMMLVDALLADIDAHYGIFRHLNRVRRPIILLQDVDLVPARRAIRDALLAAFDGRAGNLRVHPVVISTSAPGAAPAGKGANRPVDSAQLAIEIPRLFADREQAGEQRKRGGEEPLRSRLLPVRPAPAPSPDSPPPPRLHGPGPVTVIVAALVVLALAAGGVIFARRILSSCGEGLHKEGGECVGVSDGSGVFMPEFDGMKKIFAAIEKENIRISSMSHATVALVIPLESANPAVQRQILSEVQGAYIAQLQANREDGAKPAIRLALANPGHGYRHWEKIVDDVLGQPNLRVVAGFNLSLDHTKNAMSHMTKMAGLPVVAGLVTSDDFANPETPDTARHPFPGLARVVSAAGEQADALLTFEHELAGAETALVADVRPGDDYNESLREAFTSARDNRPGTGVQDMTFKSDGIEVVGTVPNRFEHLALNLCESNARYVYFAGRALHLKLFVNQLADTYCARKKSYTVVTGSDATTLDSRLDERERRLLRGDPGSGKPAVHIEYASPAHPDAWEREVSAWWQRNPGAKEPPRHLTEPREALKKLRADIAAAGIGPVALDDGRTIITHDVILTARNALTKAVALSKSEVPEVEHVKEVMSTLNSSFRIQGASGWICLTSAGNPYNKALAVVHLDPASEKLALKGIAWPEGGPPKNNCVIPQITP
ncbi:hypothetical protein C1I98_28040 [Spongiactinospora gelatinilytica]|uniref:Uncharacterized protein n=1 Tax=Spongiactinospora gelatinilytica TaxID=2666298 RepID=A0A2W2H5W1_9ACTN|nr:hypothetical protein [Spongiactinospora gelatinilytica]PZG34454.1 hypothetical protein C1I98_28040 [Spongiactinospora gelatinilytica]